MPAPSETHGRTARQRARRAWVKRANRCISDADEFLSRERELVISLLLDDIARAADPFALWAEDMPVKLRRELLRMARSAEDSLRATASADVAWLVDTLRGAGDDVDVDRPALPFENIRVPDLTNLSLARAEKISWLASMGARSVATITALVRTLVQADVTPVNALADDLAGRTRVLRRREALPVMREMLTASVSRAITDMTASVQQRITALYDDVTAQAFGAAEDETARGAGGPGCARAAEEIGELLRTIEERHAVAIGGRP